MKKTVEDAVRELVKVLREGGTNEHGDAGRDYARLGWPEFWIAADKLAAEYDEAYPVEDGEPVARAARTVVAEEDHEEGGSKNVGGQVSGEGDENVTGTGDGKAIPDKDDENAGGDVPAEGEGLARTDRDDPEKVDNVEERETFGDHDVIHRTGDELRVDNEVFSRGVEETDEDAPVVPGDNAVKIAHTNRVDDKIDNDNGGDLFNSSGDEEQNEETAKNDQDNIDNR